MEPSHSVVRNLVRKRDFYAGGLMVLLGLGVAHSLQLAVAASGFYVRHAVSPNREQLVRFLQTL